MNALSDLFPKTRAEILRLLFAGGNQEIHLRDLARLAGLSPAALQKELTSLAAKEFVLTRRDGNRLYYRANTSHPLFPDLCGIVLKTSGIAAELGRALAAVEGIDLALIFGSVAAGTATGQSDVDLLVIGTTGLRKITPALRGVADATHAVPPPHPKEPRSKAASQTGATGLGCLDQRLLDFIGGHREITGRRQGLLPQGKGKTVVFRW